jgi:TolB protein
MYSKRERKGRDMTRRAMLLPALVGAAALIACLAALVTAVHEAQAAFPGQNGRIAFSAYRPTSTGSDQQIITVSPNGTGTRQLTTNYGSTPDFSADGRKIAYAGRGGIYVMDRFGNGKRLVADGTAYDPAWSPDGSKLAFVRQEPVYGPDGGVDFHKADLWVMNADGSEQRKLTDDLAFDDNPTFSPDGTKVAFDDEGGELWTINLDGSGRHNLTNTPNSGEYHPDFSPDGKKVAFSSPGQYNRSDIYTMNLDGTARTNVTDSRYFNEEEAVWSPNGKRIAYRRELPNNDSNQPDIFVENADGSSGRPTNVSNDPELNFSPDWGPKLSTTTTP